jgi:DNA-binding CsgD family transcriptional regulator
MNQTSESKDLTPSPKNSAPREQALSHGRDAFRKKAWSTAVSELTLADSEAPIPAVQLVELAQASLLTGKDREATDALARAHQAFLELNEIQPAARCAFWLGFTALLAGDAAQSSGWLSRASRLLEGHPKCVENGYLLLPVGYRTVHGGEPGKAIEAFAQAAKIGEEFGDLDLTAMARQGHGRALIRLGKIRDGVSLLDEAMISVTGGEVSALTAGAVYCSVIEGCGEIFDLRRAQEWTSALEVWCASQPDLVPYQGHCLVRRAEILQLHGKWQEALEEAQQVCDRFSQLNPKPEVAGAYYQIAEVYRLRGEFEAAEQAYRRAGSWRETARAGMALLRLAQGQISAASAAIRRIIEDVREPAGRARILDCYVEICLAAGDIADAHEAAVELLIIAGQIDAPFLHALSKRAKGAVLLAETDPKPALALLRESLEIWGDLHAPYEVARTRVLVANACDELDDRDSATLELELALEVFEQLAAPPDCAVIEHLLQKRSKQRDGLLSSRELEVLKLVAAGKSNRAIAGRLGISEKTVARHVSNIFNKLDLSSRAAATAYAYQNKLVSST